MPKPDSAYTRSDQRQTREVCFVRPFFLLALSRDQLHRFVWHRMNSYSVQEEEDWARVVADAENDCFQTGLCPPLFDGAPLEHWSGQETEKPACDACHLRCSMEVDTYDLNGDLSGHQHISYSASFCGARVVIETDGSIVFEK